MSRASYQSHAGFSHGLRTVVMVFLLAGATYCWRQVWARSNDQRRNFRIAWLDDDRPLVVVDPGHGGMDGGTQGGGLLEKALALDTALRVTRALQGRGFRVKMTRETDVAVPLEQRAQLANDEEAAAFVSLHFDNAGRPGAKASGYEVLYTPQKSLSATHLMATRLRVEPGDPAIEAESTRLGTCIHTAMAEKLGSGGRGVRPQDLAVCRLTACPSVLIEGGFLSSTADLARLRQTAHRDDLAEAVAIGVDMFLSPNSSAKP